MKHFALIIFTLVLGIGFSANAYAQDQKIAVVDVQMLLAKSKAAQSIQSQSKSYREKFLSKLSEQEKALRADEKALIEKSKTATSKEAFVAERQAFEKKFMDTQKQAKTKKASLDKAYGVAMKTLMERIYDAVQKIAADKGYTMVLAKQSVVIGQSEHDVTEDVMRDLNKNVTSIDLKI